MKRELSKKLEELLTSGTPKKKAALICENYDAIRNHDKPILTDAEREAIMNSLKTDAEKREYNKWIDIHSALDDFFSWLLTASRSYLASANELLQYLRVWESYSREADHLNALICFMEDNAPDKLQAFKLKITSLSPIYGKFVIGKDGYIDVDISGESGLYEIILSKVENCKENMGYAKAMITAVEEFVAKKRAKIFLTPLMQNELSFVKNDMAEKISPDYSQKHLNDLKRRGAPITKEEEQRAVFPDYDTLPFNEELYEIAKKRLEEYKD
jgi:hypothetical protein